MAGEVLASQLSTSRDVRSVQLFSGNNHGPLVVSVHDVPIGASTQLIAAMPYKARLAHFGYQRTGGAAAGTCKIDYAGTTDVSESVTVSDSLRFRAGLAVDIPAGSAINFVRSDSTNSGTVICFWILLSETAIAAIKSTQIAAGGGVDISDIAVAAGALQFGWISSHIVDFLGSVPDDVQLFNANFPADSKLVAVIAGSSRDETGGAAGLVELRTAAGGAGDAISQPGNCETRNCIALGTGATVAAGASLYARGTVGGSYNYIMCIWQSAAAAAPATPGAIQASQMLVGIATLAGQATSNSGVPFVSSHTVAASAGADDVVLFPAMPAKAGVGFAIISPTAGGDSMGPFPDIRNAAGGMGDALCGNLAIGFGGSLLPTLRSADTAAAKFADAGTPSYLNRPKGLPAGDLLIFWVPRA